tara:strand:- start:529 stop:657 length:129 start_codon:yes stop_codon:yes gene_type:complete
MITNISSLDKLLSKWTGESSSFDNKFPLIGRRHWFVRQLLLP